MKRIFALLISLILLLPCFSLLSFAAEEKNLLFNVSIDGKNEIVVSPGDKITVDFTVENTTDTDGFSITNLQNEIEFDDDFFEFTEGDVELVTAYFSKYADDYSWGAKRVQLLARHIDGGKPKVYEAKQLVAKVTFKVKDGLAKGTAGKLENKVCEAKDAINGISYTISSKGMTVYIGDAPEEKYTLTYKNGETVVNTSENASGSNVKIYSGLTMTDKKFSGWKDASGKIWQPGDSYTVTKDMTFTAVWLSKYTLKFETDGGSAISDKVVWENETIDLSDCVTTKAGYTFDGWYSDSALTQKVTSVKLNGNKTVYAKWNETAKQKYTLTFNTNGGSSINSLTREEGTVVALSSYKPTKNGYTFDGWYSDSALTQKVTSVKLDGNKTVYAKWTTKSSDDSGTVPTKKYTITFKNIDGSEIGSVIYTENTTIDLRQHVPKKNGYEFEGWYTEKELINKVTSIKLTKNTVLYANWSKIASKPNYHPDMLTTEHYAYIVGRNENRIEPMANITRAEVATIFFRLLTEEVRNDNITLKNAFSDVNEGDWFNTAVSTLAKLGIIKGRSADTFAPNAKITRAEFTTIAARFSDAVHNGKDLFSDIDGHWARDYINAAASIGWVIGNNGKFRPDDNITRAEAMTLVNRMLNRLPESEADLLSNMTRWEDNADTNAWYYLAVQEATNSHEYKMKSDGIYEKWSKLEKNPDWSEFEK